MLCIGVDTVGFGEPLKDFKWGSSLVNLHFMGTSLVVVWQVNGETISRAG